MQKTSLRPVSLVILLLVLLSFTWIVWRRYHEVVIEADVLVVGAGIGGMSAAHEAGSKGSRVVVVEMNSVFGGNAVVSEGGLFIVGTPLQNKEGYHDSPSLASDHIPCPTGCWYSLPLHHAYLKHLLFMLCRLFP